MDSWIVPAFSLKNKEVFWIGLVDLPLVEPSNYEVFRIGLVDHSPRSVPDRPCVEPYKQGGIGPKCLFLFFDTMLLSAHVERVSASCKRDFLLTI